ncbi:MAG: hypothetical protein GM46_3880 [actinobacterium acAcidi]|nr:MAG: hypothetical protein GM46_3880 [actinobacterium acAcidi]
MSRSVLFQYTTSKDSLWLNQLPRLHLQILTKQLAAQTRLFWLTFEIATEQAGNITIAKLNVDDYGDIAMRFNVMSIPTLIVFNKGEAAKRLVGAVGKGKLLQELAEFLPKSR